MGSVRAVPQYPGQGYSIFCTRPELLSSVRPCHNTRNFCELCNTSIPVPETSGSSTRLPYPCPESTNPTEHNPVPLPSQQQHNGVPVRNEFTASRAHTAISGVHIVEWRPLSYQCNSSAAGNARFKGSLLVGITRCRSKSRIYLYENSVRG